MEKFNIILIKPNEFKFDKNIDSLEDDYLYNKIKDFVEFHELSLDSMMEFIIDKINLTTEIMGSTSMCFENNEYVYQLCHLNRKDVDNNEQLDDYNGLGSTLVMGNSEEVCGNCVLICSKVGNNNLCTTYSLDKSRLLYILKKKLIHTGIEVETDGSINKFTYFDNPLENVDGDEIENKRYIELPFLNFNLILILEKLPKDDTINKKATKLFGNSIVNGKVILVSKSSEDEFLDIDEELFEKMLKASEGDIKKRELSEEEKKDGEQNEDNLPIVMNRYCILENRLKNYESKCFNCNNNIDENSLIMVCTGCYRVKYDSKECQKENWKNHKNDCLFGKKPINNYIK